MWTIFKTLIMCGLVPAFAVSQISSDNVPDSLQKKDREVLESGFKHMLYLLKAGQRDSAHVWFGQNYDALKKYGMLADSVVKAFSAPVLNSDSLAPDTTEETLEGSLKTLIKKEAYDIARTLKEDEKLLLPDDFIEDIEAYIVKFTQTKQYKSFFQGALRRSRKYVPAFERFFTEKGFPKEVIYFAIIESGFDPNAISKAGAVGMFQFMPGTARDYGLNVTPKNDERFSPLKSARASAEYLKDLYLELGALNLALASYNGGAARTRSALRKLENVRSRSFWTLREEEKLVSETNEYVPQIFAAIILARPGNAQKFGLEEVVSPKEESYDIFYLQQSINLAELTAHCNIPINEIYELNRDLVSNSISTPTAVVDYPFFAPRSKGACVKNWLNENLGNAYAFDGTDATGKSLKAPKSKSKVKKTKPKKRFDPAFIVGEQTLQAGDEIEYKAIRGNTVFTLARIFNVTTQDLMKWNGLKFKSLQEGQVLRIRLNDPLTHYIYSVPHKSSFSDLAERFDVAVDVLQRTNDFKAGMMEKGDTLNVYLLGEIK